MGLFGKKNSTKEKPGKDISKTKTKAKKKRGKPVPDAEEDFAAAALSDDDAVIIEDSVTGETETVDATEVLDGAEAFGDDLDVFGTSDGDLETMDDDETASVFGDEDDGKKEKKDKKKKKKRARGEPGKVMLWMHRHHRDDDKGHVTVLGVLTALALVALLFLRPSSEKPAEVTFFYIFGGMPQLFGVFAIHCAFDDARKMLWGRTKALLIIGFLVLLIPVALHFFQ